MKKKLSAVLALLLAAVCLGGCAAGETVPETAAPEVTEAVSETETETTAGTTTETTTEETTVETTTAEEKINCPNVLGMQKEEAVAILEDLGLEVNFTTENDYRVGQGTITKQSVKADKKILPGSEITITAAEWSENYYLLDSVKILNTFEADNEFIYTYDDRGLVTGITFNMYNSFNGEGDGHLMHSDKYTIEYSDDLSEVKVVDNYTEYPLDDEPRTTIKEDICYFNGTALTKAGDGDERTVFNTFDNNSAADDYYWGKNERYEQSFDENGLIVQVIYPGDDKPHLTADYFYKTIPAESIESNIVNLNKLVMASVYPASKIWFNS